VLLDDDDDDDDDDVLCCVVLLSGHDDDIVKLYDLTTLCATMMDDVHDNPFTVPVGVLLYRVARNMHEINPQKSNVICALLKNCLDLLDVNKHAQVIRVC